MAESLFDIFGDNLTRQAVRHVSRQPLCNIENMGKSVSTGPVKPNEPIKKVGRGIESKKSFLGHTGKALQNTPSRQAFTPIGVNVGSLIYSDAKTYKEDFCEELEFTKPTYKNDNYHRDLLDYLPVPEPEILAPSSPKTPPPNTRRHSFELESPYEHDFITDDFSYDSIPEEDLGLPELY